MMDVGLKTPAGRGRSTFFALGGVAGNEGEVAGAGSVADDVPWADDMLCGSSRRRHAEMLRSRGRTLAQSLTRLLSGVSADLRGVASRLPPWEEDDDEEGEASVVRRFLCVAVKAFSGKSYFMVTQVHTRHQLCMCAALLLA